MKHLVLSLVLALVLSPRSESEPLEPADTVFVNGNVYTVNDAQPQAEAIAIKGDRIVFVGSNEDANKYSGPATRTIDLKGKDGRAGIYRLALSPFRGWPQAAQPSFDETTSARGTVLAKVKEQTEEGRPGKVDHRPRLDRDLLEARRFSQSRESWTRSRRPTRSFSSASMATAQSRTVRR